MVQFRSSDRYCVHIGKTNLVQGSGKIMNRLLMLMCDTFSQPYSKDGLIAKVLTSMCRVSRANISCILLRVL